METIIKLIIIIIFAYLGLVSFNFFIKILGSILGLLIGALIGLNIYEKIIAPNIRDKKNKFDADDANWH